MRHLSTLARLILLSFIIFLTGVLLIKSSLDDSAIYPEPANLASGYGYIRYLDYRLDPARPPLGKALLALPLILSSGEQKLNFPLASLNWQRDINSSQAVGQQFLYESGNDPDRIINAGRIVPIILTLILILAIYWVSKELIGKWWALLPAFLFSFFPTALAYGHYATISVPATLSIFLAVVAFLNFLNKPSKKRLILSGVTFGLAQMTTFAALILVPYFLLTLTIFYLAGVVRDRLMTDPQERWRRFGLRAGRYFWSLLAIFGIGFSLVFIFYLFFTWNYPIEKQMSDTAFILDQFQPRWLGDLTMQLSKTPILRAAAHYLLGIALNWPADYPGSRMLISVALKTPLAALLLILISAGFSSLKAGQAVWSMIRRRTKNFSDYLNTSFTEFAMLIFVIFYWIGGAAFGSGNMEKILPTLPFFFILIASGIKKWSAGAELENARNLVLKIFIVYEEFLQLSLKSAALVIILAVYFVTTLIAYPHFLSFSNLIAGGTKNGHQYLTGADYDLGQDIKRLKTWTELNLPEGDKIAVDYYGGGNVKITFSEAEEWNSAKGSPSNIDIYWLAVSATSLATAKKSLNAEDQYQWLTASAGWRTYARVGTSIFIYKL